VAGKIGIVYNNPIPGNLHNLGESDAVLGVLEAVANVKKVVDELGYEVQILPLSPPMASAKSELRGLKADLVFNLFEGFDDTPGSEADMARVMEQMGFRFTGSPSRALALAQNKSEEKTFLRKHGVPTPDWQVITPETLAQFHLVFPCIIKPMGEHASHGISEESVVYDQAALEKRVKYIQQSYHCASLVEEYIDGREFSALVVGNESPRLFPVEEIIFSLPHSKPHILTYAAKWVPEDEYFIHTKTKCPAELTPAELKRIEEIALLSFKSFGCRGYARVDMRQRQNGDILVLEVNPNPDISSEGGARLQAEVAGMEYPVFIREIIKLAMAGSVEPVKKA